MSDFRTVASEFLLLPVARFCYSFKADEIYDALPNVKPGDVVRLCGLTSHPHYNSCQAQIVKKEPTGRWEVVTFDDKHLSVRHCSIYVHGHKWNSLPNIGHIVGIDSFCTTAAQAATRIAAPFRELGGDVVAAFGMGEP